jgi:hypothetical protein
VPRCAMLLNGPKEQLWIQRRGLLLRPGALIAKKNLLLLVASRYVCPEREA